MPARIHRWLRVAGFSSTWTHSTIKAKAVLSAETGHGEDTPAHHAPDADRQSREGA